MTMPFLTMDGVSYRPPYTAQPLLHDITLHMQAGERIGLVGRSGSGKSTLLNLLLALAPTTQGSICCLQQPVRPGSVRSLRDYRRRVQYIPQDPATSLHPQMRVSDLLLEPLRRLGHERDPARRIAEVLDQVGLAGSIAHQCAGQLSGGQAQRVAIARAIILRPDFLLADEPLSSLDLPLREQITALFAHLAAETGMGMLMVSHDMACVAALCPRMVVLEQGQIVEDRPTAQLLAGPAHPCTRALLAAVPRLTAPRLAS